MFFAEIVITDTTLKMKMSGLKCSIDNSHILLPIKNCMNISITPALRNFQKAYVGAISTLAPTAPMYAFLENSQGWSFRDIHTIIWEEQDISIIYRAFQTRHCYL